ncbi:energy transducer TonB [Paenalcaligenes faecalis]|uniref:energy transducer TonB n=1 Tax=Paenalcaligenes faecalis TaxID=2980099 RepID=UPI0022B9CE04|nr:energy transducer TonB [Paenalcaligenes faecalis]
MSLRHASILSDFLWPAVILSLLAHGLVLYYAWPNGIEKKTLSPEPTIALINYKNEEPVLNALLLAQWQAAGGGESHDQEAASAPFSGQNTPSPNDLVLQAMRERLRQMEQNQQARLVQLESEWQALHATPDSEPESEHTGQQDQDEHTLRLSRELHVLKSQITHYNSQPRIHFDAPSANASPYAAYIEDWRAKIERLGTEHYPDQAKGLLSDALQLTVYIDKNGSLLKVDIHQPAQNPIFNVAAQRIIRLAAPFGPFSPEMQEHSDVIAITRSWRFTQGSLTTE